MKTITQIYTDVININSTVDLIKLTTNTIQIGDIIHFTSGPLTGLEIAAAQVAFLAVTMPNSLPSIPQAGTTVTIFRVSYPPVSSVLVDEVSASVNYFGFAISGATTSASLWQIKKLVVSGTVTSILYANGNTNYTNVWDNRASLTYL